MQNILTRIRLNLSRNKNKIFVSGGEPYFGNLTKELLKNKKNRVFNFSGKLSRSFFVGLNYLPFYEFKGIKFSEEELKKDAIDLEKNIDKNFSKIYGIETEIENSIKKKLISIVNTNSEVFSKLEEFYSFIKDEKIDLIITSEESDPLSRGIIQIANKFNVPTMIFQHGLFMSEIATYSNADYVFSIEEKQKDLYLKSSSKKTKVNVMGIPRYDSFKKTEKQRKEKIILYIMEVSRKLDMVPETHLTKKQQKEILRIIFNVMKKFKDYKLIVKTRPGWEMAGLPESIAKEQNFKNAEFIEKTDNNQLLNDSDLIIVNFSSMGYEALLLKKPVISLSYKNVKKFNPYEKIEVVEKVYTEKELYDSIVKNLKKGGYREEGLEKYFEVNKNSSQDISNFINKVLNMYKRR